MADKITLLQEQLGKIIKGKKQITDKMLMAVLAKGHILLDDSLRRGQSDELQARKPAGNIR